MTYEQILINGISERDKRIAELEEIIRGRDELINNAVSSRIAELELSRKDFMEVWKNEQT